MVEISSSGSGEGPDRVTCRPTLPIGCISNRCRRLRSEIFSRQPRTGAAPAVHVTGITLLINPTPQWELPCDTCREDGGHDRLLSLLSIATAVAHPARSAYPARTAPGRSTLLEAGQVPTPGDADHRLPVTALTTAPRPAGDS
jgi:hypothetical protein